MPTQLYDVRIIDHKTGALKTIIAPQQILGLRYNIVLRDVGALVITLPYHEALWNSCATDDFIEVYGPGGAKEETYLLRGREIYFEDSTLQMAFMGVGLNDLIRRRLILPDSTGYSTKAGDAVTVLSEFANEALGPGAATGRSIPLLTISADGTGNGVGARVRYEALLDTMQGLAERGAIDFWIERTTGRNLVLNIARRGTNKTYSANYPINPAMVFSPDRGNVLNPRLKESRMTEANYVYVLGEGEGASQFVYQLPGVGITASNYNRIETKSTIRRDETDSTSQTEIAVTRAVEVLADGEKDIEFDFDIPTDVSDGMMFGTDYVLGDTVTVAWRGVQVNLRITEIETTLSPAGVLARSLKLQTDNGA